MDQTKILGTDFRQFLATYAEEKRKNHPGWSYAVWAKHLGLKSTSSITKVINGQREPGSDLVDKLVKYFRFNREQEEQFRKLVLISKKNIDPKLRSSLMETDPNKLTKVFDGKLIELFEFRLIANWWNLALREILKVKGLVHKSDQLMRLFKDKIEANQVKESLSLLERLGLIRKSPQLQYEVPHRSVMTHSEIPSEAIQNYHLQMLEQAKHRIADTQVNERHFEGLVLLLSEDKIPEAKVMLQKFLDEFDEKFGQSPKPDYLYQIQLQFFPLTKKLN